MEKQEQAIREKMEAGYHCSQVMMLLRLEAANADDELLVRALGGLGGGMASGRACGTLTGGCCVLASCAPALGGMPRGNDGSYKPAAAQLVQWFSGRFGSCNCADLVGAERAERLATCPGIIRETFAECVRLLTEAGVDVHTL